MNVLLNKKTGRNEICPCQPTEKKTVNTADGTPITFTTYKKGGKKFKHCHAKLPFARKQIYVNTNEELTRLRNSGQVGRVAV